jgi:hypothetical protein
MMKCKDSIPFQWIERFFFKAKVILSVKFAAKEQCVVLFRYDAVNEDELSLDEGQV